MKIAITGHEGNIGSRLVRLGCEPLCCDVTNSADVYNELQRVKPDVVLHLAAMTSVDWCEKHYQETLAVNVFGTSVVCEQAEKVLGAGRVALISTDQVFDGKKGLYSEEDLPNPINNYGFSKLGAEAVANLYGIKIIRISRCFDSKSKDINAYLRQLEKGEEIFVPNLTRSYLHMDFVALDFLEYAKRFDEMPSLLHIAGQSSCAFVSLMLAVAQKQRLPLVNIHGRGDEPGYVKRPWFNGLDVSLMKSLNLPVYDLYNSIQKLGFE